MSVSVTKHKFTSCQGVLCQHFLQTHCKGWQKPTPERIISPVSSSGTDASLNLLAEQLWLHREIYNHIDIIRNVSGNWLTVARHWNWNPTGKRPVIAAGQLSPRVVFCGNLSWNLIIFCTYLYWHQHMVCCKFQSIPNGFVDFRRLQTFR